MSEKEIVEVEHLANKGGNIENIYCIIPIKIVLYQSKYQRFIFHVFSFFTENWVKAY